MWDIKDFVAMRGRDRDTAGIMDVTGIIVRHEHRRCRALFQGFWGEPLFHYTSQQPPPSTPLPRLLGSRSSPAHTNGLHPTTLPDTGAKTPNSLRVFSS